MSNYLLRTLAQAEGYCCEITYLATFEDKENREIAEYIGVCRKTIQRTRLRIKRCELTCPGCCRDLVKYYTWCLSRAKKEIRKASFVRPSHISEAHAIEHYARELWIQHFRRYAEEKTDEDPGYLRALSAYRILTKPHIREPVHPDAGTTLEVGHKTESAGDSGEDSAD